MMKSGIARLSPSFYLLLYACLEHAPNQQGISVARPIYLNVSRQYHTALQPSFWSLEWRNQSTWIRPLSLEACRRQAIGFFPAFGIQNNLLPWACNAVAVGIRNHCSWSRIKLYHNISAQCLGVTYLKWERTNASSSLVSFNVTMWHHAAHFRAYLQWTSACWNLQSSVNMYKLTLQCFRTCQGTCIVSFPDITISSNLKTWIGFFEPETDP